MDALTLLREEMKRKRKEMEDSGVLEQGKSTGTTHFKRGKLEQVYQERVEKAHMAPYEHVLAEPDDKHATDKSNVIAAEDVDDFLPDEEVKRRLRKRGEPIKLFGETATDTRRRLRDLEILAPELEQRVENDYQQTLEHADEDYVIDLLKKKQGDDGKKGPEEALLSLEDLAKAYGPILDEQDMERKQKCMYKIIKNLMNLWEVDLDNRPDVAKLSTDGRHASTTFKQTREYIKPLLKKLKIKSMEEDLAGLFASMIKSLLAREYIQANDKYLQIAIGNAPWPIGVTNVGIHSRAGREKIFTQHVAHVLNDEHQRKYLQAWKRLMTYCQLKFPTDPSKSVEFHGMDTMQYGITPHSSSPAPEH